MRAAVVVCEVAVESGWVEAGRVEWSDEVVCLQPSCMSDLCVYVWRWVGWSGWQSERAVSGGSE